MSVLSLLLSYGFTEAAIGDDLWKKLLLKVSQYSHEHTCVGLSALRPATLLKRDCNSSVFSYILRKPILKKHPRTAGSRIALVKAKLSLKERYTETIKLGRKTLGTHIQTIALR